MKKKIDAYSFFKYFTLIGYILCIVVLVVESCINGNSSTQQSSSLGNIIANVFNNLTGDQASEIQIESISIENKIAEAYVGDNYTLNTKIEPENATNKGLKYISSNENVAAISNDGTISFLKEGYVTITASSESYSNILDSFSINVKPVLLQSISSSIKNLNPDENDVYTLNLGNKYAIDTVFNPLNTTDKSLSYTIDNSSYIELNNNIIDVKNISHNEITCITIKQGNISSTIKVKTTQENVIDLKNIEAALPNVCVGQLATPSINFNPSNATFTDYTLSTNNDNVSIINNYIKGNKIGRSSITVTSKYYPTISNTFDIDVISSPTMTSFNMGLIEKIAIGHTRTVAILPEPSYASIPDISKISFSSSDTSIASIDSKGVISPIKEGKTIISATCNNLSVSKEITVYSPSSPIDETFDVLISDDSFTATNIYNLNERVKILNLSSNDDTIEYFLEDSSIGSINKNYLTINNFVGETKLYVVHTPSYSIKEIPIRIVSPFKLIDKDGNLLNQINLEYQKEFEFKISSEIPNQTYKITTLNSNKLYISKRNDSYFINNFNTSIEDELIITPCVNSVPASLENSIILDIKLKGVTTSSLSYKIINVDTGKTYNPRVEKNHNIRKTDNIQVIPLLSEGTTFSDMIFTSSNPEVALINQGGYIKVNKIGTTIITLKDNVSTLSETFTLNLFNTISLESNNYTISGDKVKYNEETQTYILTNGYSARLKINFHQSSTYTIAAYNSNNDDIVSISSDGSITPKKVGLTKITATIDDGMITPLVFEINVEVVKKDLIDNLDEFHMIIRKSIGHFGAFLVFGVFTSLTFIFFFKQSTKKDILISFINGFGVAALTELIQLIVPGRVGSFIDVLINLSGFLIAMVIIIFILERKKAIDLTKK